MHIQKFWRTNKTITAAWDSTENYFSFIVMSNFHGLEFLHKRWWWLRDPYRPLLGNCWELSWQHELFNQKQSMLAVATYTVLPTVEMWKDFCNLKMSRWFTKKRYVFAFCWNYLANFFYLDFTWNQFLGIQANKKM